MARDYKNSGRRKRRSNGAPGWLWMAGGLIIGLFVAFLVYLDGRPPGKPVPKQVSVPVEQADEGEPLEPVKPPKPRDEPPPKPRFDFYTILPEMEVVVPDQEVTGKPKKGLAQVDKPGTYFLQTGSFKAFDQADRLKAQLALLGLEASIETVTINNKETWHRVRVGPYKNLNDLNKARALLNENNITAVLLKVKS